MTLDEPLDSARARKLLLVASTGGHLAQLVRMADSLGASDESVWLTFESPQSTSLLAGRRTHFVPYVRPRDVRGVIRASRSAGRLLDEESFDGVVSTGAAVALAALPLAKRRGIPTMYIESVSRVTGPSLTGRILAAGRMAEMRTQHPGWASARWRLHPGVFGEFETVARAESDSPSLFVTLGTIRGFRFDSLVDAVLRTGLADERTVWQLGETRRSDLPGTVVESMEAEEFADRAAAADVVITHSGVGTIIGMLESGIHPVVVPRRRSRHEHVDDHQEQIARYLSELGLATVTEAPDLTVDHLRRAAGLSVVATVRDGRRS
ncbi:glycosyltransferase [Schumannella luteola]